VVEGVGWGSTLPGAKFLVSLRCALPGCEMGWKESGQQRDTGNLDWIWRCASRTHILSITLEQPPIGDWSFPVASLEPSPSHSLRSMVRSVSPKGIAKVQKGLKRLGARSEGSG
jgi:hypothetical protein